MSNSALMLGMLLGAFILGELADCIGRKLGLLVNISVLIIGGLLGAFSVNYYMFLAARVISGMGTSSMIAISFIIVIEFVPQENRNLCGILIWIVFSFGAAAVGPISYFLREWRLIQLACTIPAFFLFLYYWIMPESIRWSLCKGRIEEAKETIKRIEKCNGVKVSEKTYQTVIDNSFVKLRGEVETQQEKNNAVVLLKDPTLIILSLKLMFCWMTIAMTFYGLSMNSANLGGNLFVNYTAVIFIEIPAYVFTYFILDRLGRKYSLMLYFFIGGLACFISISLPSTLNTAIKTLNMIGKFGISAAFAAIYVYTAELLPTPVRSLGIGICSTAARVGAILAPFLTDWSKILAIHPFLIYGILSILSVLFILNLPETLGCELPQTIEQSRHFGKEQKMFITIPALKKMQDRRNQTLETTMQDVTSF